MSSSYEIVRIAHIATGTLALATFWLAGLARKGSPVHKLAGKVYLATMAAVVVSATPMAAIIALRKNAVLGAFLGYLLVLTATGVWLSWRAIRDKRDFAAYTGRVYHALAWMNIAAGASVFALGVSRAIPLFAGFSLIGVVSGISMLRYARRQPDGPRWWLAEHLGAMLGNGIATHIAFLAIGLPRLVPALNTQGYMYLAWFAPVVIAQVARVLLMRRYVTPPADQSQRSSRTQTAPASRLTGITAVGS